MTNVNRIDYARMKPMTRYGDKMNSDSMDTRPVVQSYTTYPILASPSTSLSSSSSMITRPSLNRTLIYPVNDTFTQIPPQSPRFKNNTTTASTRYEQLEHFKALLYRPLPLTLLSKNYTSPLIPKPLTEQEQDIIQDKQQWNLALTQRKQQLIQLFEDYYLNGEMPQLDMNQWVDDALRFQEERDRLYATLDTAITGNIPARDFETHLYQDDLYLKRYISSFDEAGWYLSSPGPGRPDYMYMGRPMSDFIDGLIKEALYSPSHRVTTYVEIHDATFSFDGLKFSPFHPDGITVGRFDPIQHPGSQRRSRTLLYRPHAELRQQLLDNFRLWGPFEIRQNTIIPLLTTTTTSIGRANNLNPM